MSIFLAICLLRTLGVVAKPPAGRLILRSLPPEIEPTREAVIANRLDRPDEKFIFIGRILIGGEPILVLVRRQVPNQDAERQLTEIRTTPDQTQKKMRFSMTLQIPFESFDAQKWTIITEKLAAIAECPTDQIKLLAVHEGCTITHFEMPEESGRKLLQAFTKFLKDPKNPQHLDAMKKLAEEHHVTQLYELSPRLTEILLTTIEKPKVESKSLLFVHGWRGDATSFGKLPEFLAQICGCQARIYSYPTGIFTLSPSIVFVADALRNYIANHMARQAIAVVCHSMGGLVVRQAMIAESHSDRRLDLNIDNISFIASPHIGSAYADIGKKIPILASAQIKELAEIHPLCTK
jgi:hypothetical protein